MNVPERIKLLLIGERGVGKTTQIAHLANAGFRVKVLDIDNKLQILQSHLKPGIEIDAVTLPAKVATTWETAISLLDKWPNEPMVKWGSDVVFVVDTASLLSDTCLSFSKIKMGAADKNVKFEQAIWMEYAERFEHWTVRVLSDVHKFHVVFLCHPAHVPASIGAAKIGPFFEGQRLVERMPRNFNCVWLIERRNDKNIIRTTTYSGALLTNAFPKAVPNETSEDLGILFREALGR